MADYDPLFLERLFAFIKYMDSFNVSSLAEIFSYSLVVLLLYHGYKKYGRNRILLYFTGALLLTGLEENFMVIQGYFQVLGEVTYYYNFHQYMFWIVAVPFAVPCAWFILSYSSFQIAETIISSDSSRPLLKQLIVAGWIGTSIDFVIDPIVIRLWSWIWLLDQPETVWFLQVPITNFLGFFLLVVAFNYYFVWYWDQYSIKHETWSSKRKTATYLVMVFLPLLAVIGIIILFAILQTPFRGIDLSWWEWPS
ncbi:MAG: carotenoid biosynthesis protein [Candidatus Thorarchaeota archaeon]